MWIQFATLLDSRIIHNNNLNDQKIARTSMMKTTTNIMYLILKIYERTYHVQYSIIYYLNLNCNKVVDMSNKNFIFYLTWIKKSRSSHLPYFDKNKFRPTTDKLPTDSLNILKISIWWFAQAPHRHAQYSYIPCRICILMRHLTF